MKVINKRSSYVYLLIILLSGLYGCAANSFPETSTPNYDQRFGQAVQKGLAEQKIPVNEQNGIATSKEMKTSYDNYIKGKVTSAPILQFPLNNMTNTQE